MNGNMTALFQKIAKSKASAGGNIIKDGKYLFCIHNLLIDAKFNGNMFIAEMEVIEAHQLLDDVEPNKVGTTASYVVNLDKNQSAGGNAKALVLALLNAKEDETSEEDFVESLQTLVSKGQPARGMLIADETFRKPIRSGPNAGKPFTAHRWQYVEQTAEQIAARRARIDKSIASSTSTAAA